MKYRATIHTLEIKPLLPDRTSVKQWQEKVYELNKPYVNDIRRSKGKKPEPRLTINPHKITQTDAGLFHFEYFGLKRYRDIMDSICKELDMNGYIIRRFDVCLDTDQSYGQTDKLTRFILLLMGDNINAGNRYSSYDPLTLEPKTMRIQNGDKKSKTLEAEHYNRAVITQEKWDATVVNRLELRAMGEQTGEKHEERSIIENWIKRLRSVERADVRGIESTLNAGIFAKWQEYAARSGKHGVQEFNAFLRFRADHIYTRRQLKELFSLYGHSDPERATEHIIERSGSIFDSLFTDQEIRLATGEMIEALTEFITG